MRMTLPVRRVFLAERRAMPAHRVREAGVKKVVVATGELLQHDGEIFLLLGRGVHQPGQCGLGHQQGLEGPDRPVGHHGQPVLALDHDAAALLQLAFDVIEQQAAAIGLEVAALGFIRAGHLVGQEVTGPDLTMRVRVGAAHGRTLVLEDLHPAPAFAQFTILLDPGGDDGLDDGRRKLRQRLAVIGREADDARGSPHRHALQERIVGTVLGRVGQQRREVVGKDVGLRVVGVDLAADARVARAQVAAWVMAGTGCVVDVFLLALPGASGTMGRDQNPAVLQRVVAAMRVFGGIEHDVGCARSGRREAWKCLRRCHVVRGLASHFRTH